MRKKNTARTLKRGGIAFYVLIGVIIVGAFAMMGGIRKMQLSPSGDLPASGGMCCDSGDGAACIPSRETDKTLTFRGSNYGLIKAKVVLIEGNLHLIDSGENFQGNPIILNSSQDHLADRAPEVNSACGRDNPMTEKKDLYFKKRPADPYMFMKNPQPPSVMAQYCTSIPDDELIFVCKENCVSAACSFPVSSSSDISCYGTDKTLYDVYYKLSNFDSSGIPDFIKNCDKSGNTSTGTKIHITPVSNQPQRDNLQLQTFGIGIESINPGFSPWCKPAIYLYPEKTTPVSVQVKPVGPIIYSNPPYPASGWNVIASPNGQIESMGTFFDYLYYEAQIPDSKIEKPTSGYVVKKADVKKTLETLLPHMGLNPKETAQFVEYWVKVIPSSPYFFIGIISQENLNTIAPLSISPKPNATLRISLYFEALENKILVTPPVIKSGNVRTGFTVVEWGGIFKKDKNHPFSCFM